MLAMGLSTSIYQRVTVKSLDITGQFREPLHGHLQSEAIVTSSLFALEEFSAITRGRVPCDINPFVWYITKTAEKTSLAINSIHLVVINVGCK